MNRHTLTLIATLSVAVASAVLSTTAAADPASAPSRAERREQMKQAKDAFKERFAAADANHDGKLTKEESKDKMPKVYEHFDEIDSARKGSVTPRDVGKWMRSQRDASGAAR